MGYDINAAFSFPDHAVCQGRKALCDRVMTVREAFMKYAEQHIK
jgi:hypothetical protein